MKGFFMLCMVALVSASLTDLKIQPFASEENAQIKLTIGEKGNKFFFVPAKADAKVKVLFEGETLVLTKNGETETLTAGNNESAFLATDGKVKAALAGEEIEFDVMKSENNLDTIFIALNQKKTPLEFVNAAKDNAGKGDIYFNGGDELKGKKDKMGKPTLKKIKGRGNTTWLAPKKPYNINFEDKFDVYDFGISKKWSVLANYYDRTAIRNNVAYDFARLLGNFKWTPECKPIDFIMDGNYYGSYSWCEKVEIDDSRVPINGDLKDYSDLLEEAKDRVFMGTGVDGAVEDGTVKNSRKWTYGTVYEDDDGVEHPIEPVDIDGGYIIEFEYAGRYPGEVSGFVSNHGQAVTFKEPEFVDERQVKYIADFYQQIEDAIYSKDGINPTTGKHYTELIDMKTFVDMYILHEYTMCEDSGLTSTYFYKEKGDNILYAGPAWDFDNAIANDNIRYRFNFDMTDAGIWWANANYYGKSLEEGVVYEYPTIFNALYQHEDFRAAVTKRWQELKTTKIGEYENIFAKVKADAEALVARIEKSVVIDGYKWDFLGEDKVAEYKKQAQIVISYIKDREAALDKGFSENAAMVYYDANGGSGFVFNDKIVRIGEKLTLKGVDVPTSEITREGYTFKHWSLSPDGRGASYPAGSKFTPNIKTTTLYAQWKEDKKKMSDGAIIGIAVGAGAAVVIVAILLFAFFF